MYWAMILRHFILYVLLTTAKATPRPTAFAGGLWTRLQNPLPVLRPVTATTNAFLPGHFRCNLRFFSHDVAVESDHSNHVRNNDPAPQVASQQHPRQEPLQGILEGFVVDKHYVVPPWFNLSAASILTSTAASSDLVEDDNNHASPIQRLNLMPDNVTLPIALVLLDPGTYPTITRARKAIRKRTIVVLDKDNYSIDKGSAVAIPKKGNTVSTTANGRYGRVGARVQHGEIIGHHVRADRGVYANFVSNCHAVRPAFDLPVVYQDDHCAVVNKPAGISVYRPDTDTINEKYRLGQTIRFALPYVLSPPPGDGNSSDGAVLRRPEVCHRLDKPTSGVLLIAKTKRAAVHLTQQFEARQIQKTYAAILNGKLVPPSGAMVSVEDAWEKYGVTVKDNNEDGDHHGEWYVADGLLDGQVATTLWRIRSYHPSRYARDNCLTMVELKPKTGRYHQLRRQMAWMYGCPIWGDTIYVATNDKRNASSTSCEEEQEEEGDDEGDADHVDDLDLSYHKRRWGRGLMLCSSSISFVHPSYTKSDAFPDWLIGTMQGHAGATATASHSSTEPAATTASSTGRVQIVDDGDGVMRVTASVDLPSKFQKFLDGEENQYRWWQRSRPHS